MQLHEVLRARHSTRAFSTRRVDDALLRSLIEDAREAPSWSNTQPYRVAIATGALCETLRRDLVTASTTRLPSPEAAWPSQYPPVLQARRRATGYGLYAALGIDRQDSEARARQFQRNYEMFDAPAAIFLFAHTALGEYAALDAGCFLMALLLSATDKGLGSCAQAALACYPDVVRARFDIDDDWRLLCGVAIGYEEHTAVNAFRPARASVDELLVAPRSTPTTTTITDR
jgi:nitroreductase